MVAYIKSLDKSLEAFRARKPKTPQEPGVQNSEPLCPDLHKQGFGIYL